MIVDSDFAGMCYAARTLTNGAVLGTLAAAADAGTVEQPMAGYSTTRTVPADWTEGVVAARMVADVARTTMYEYARQARSSGVGWQDLADPLGIVTDDPNRDRAVAAFELIAGVPPQRFDRVMVSWLCTTCQHEVTDTGPYDRHPGVYETGHASDCARHLNEIRAYEERVDL